MKGNKSKPSNRKWRLGNFYVRESGAYIEVSDFSGLWRLKVHKTTPLGMNLIGLCVESPEVADVYVKLLWALGNIVPDVPYLEGLWKCYQDCLERYPKEPDQGDQAEIEELEKLEAFLNMPDGVLNEELEKVQAEFDKALAEKRKDEEKGEKQEETSVS